MPTEAELAHTQQAAKVLGSFQLLEFGLKLYIATSYKIINKKLNGLIPFNFGAEDLQNYPLERLLNLFKKHNANTILQKRLNALKDSRNLIAHEVLIYSIESFRLLHEVDLAESHEEMERISIELSDCLDLVLVEVQNVCAIADSLGA